MKAAGIEIQQPNTNQALMGLVQKIKYYDVEGIRVGRFKSRISTTCILFRFQNVVIDTGPPNQWPVVRTFLQSRRGDRVLITHHHEDHSGNGANIQGKLNMPVLAPEKSRDFLARGYPVELYRRVVWGKPALFNAEQLPERLLLHGGTSLQSIEAPGHSSDMTVFLIPERGWLFSGDLFIVKHPHFSRRDEDHRQEIASLQNILTYDFDTVFCGHSGIIQNGAAAIRQKLEYLEWLREQVSTLRQKGFSARQIRDQLLGGENMMTWLTGFHFSRLNLIKEFLNEKEVS